MCAHRAFTLPNEFNQFTCLSPLEFTSIPNFTTLLYAEQYLASCFHFFSNENTRPAPTAVKSTCTCEPILVYLIPFHRSPTNQTTIQLIEQVMSLFLTIPFVFINCAAAVALYVYLYTLCNLFPGERSRATSLIKTLFEKN